MPEEKRRISPVVVIVGGLGLGLAAAVGIAALSRAWAAPPTVYTCPHCGAEFDTEEELLAHIELEHPELPPPALANLYGVVTDAETGYPIEGVKVTIDGLTNYTDSLGQYAFQELTPGSYTISFEKEGYEPVISDILLVEGNNELNVEMVPIVAAPFSFSNLWVERVRCESATAWNTLNFGCTITNPTDRSITHTLTPMFRVGYKGGYSDPISREEYAVELTLSPGQSYNYYLPGNQPDRCTMLLGFSAGVPYGGCAFLRDENGNDSPQACV
ncbi:hypothetical protein ES703_49022 [subsurface metagenome]